ncbi:MAG: hypothetical protein GF315_12435 [candidate division Zixibacteria bacterium]|nr:hypothetical protein [candidate division Zixibacteria bacterium]
MLGNILLYIAFGASIVSIISYLYNYKTESGNLIFARVFYSIFASAAVAATIYLLVLFLTNQFEYRYVFAYSSLDLPTHFKISALWGGQEGTFMLWLFFAVLLGIWVMFRSGRDESLIMPIFIMAQMFLFFLMFVQSPFAKMAGVPPDGRGLNPLLQNFWMVIHPPIVFVGYASLSIPFAFAVAAMIKNRYDNWVRLTMPWVGFSAAVLFLGIFLGGYWAYETLGWGGYWAWDPVENSSLVPWLFSVALLHGMLIERSRGSMRKSNLFLTSAAYVMVLYGTFLTRSGVLADFSVHSFVDLGLNNWLLGSLGFYGIASLGLLTFRSRNIPSSPTSTSNFSLDFFIFVTLLFLVLSGVIVLLGTSAPIITGFMGNASAMRMAYYINTHLPLAIFMTIAMSLFPFAIWKFKGSSEVKKRALQTMILPILSVVIGLIAGADFLHLILLFTSTAALGSNAILFYDRAKANFLSTAGMVTHIGLAVMIIGVIGSSGYSITRQIFATETTRGEAFGRDFLLKDVEQIKRGQKRIDMAVKRDDTNFTAKMYFTDSEGGQVRTPYIKKYLLYDLYISPGQLEEPERLPPIMFAKNEIKEVGEYEVEFLEFNSRMDESVEGGISVAAMVKIITDDSSYVVNPLIISGVNGFESKPAITEFGGVINIAGINAEQGKISLLFEGFGSKDHPQASETLYFQVSTKPLINLVWLGAVMMVVGTFLSFGRRAKAARKGNDGL